MNVIQLGRYEYWMATTAVSPPYMYSSGSIMFGFTQPVPVVVATTRTFRLKAPVRSSSLTASADSAAIEGADFSPAYTRIGSIAVVPVNLPISATVGPLATNVLPCLPSVAHGTSDSGLPDRRAAVGSDIPAAVLLSMFPKKALAAPSTARDSTPVTRNPSTRQTTSTAVAVAARRGMTRPSGRATSRTSHRMPRPTMIRAAAISIVTRTTRM